MKNLTQLLFTLFCLCLPAMLQAQDKDDSKYLAGAVPEVDGKVVFTKEFSIPGMSQDEIYERLLGWMDARLKENENTSRVVFSDKEKGQIVGIGDEWIVFSSTALSLDRTKILYQLTVTCQPEKSVLEVEKIRFNYRERKIYRRGVDCRQVCLEQGEDQTGTRTCQVAQKNRRLR